MNCSFSRARSVVRSCENQIDWKEDGIRCVDFEFFNGGHV